MPNHALCLYEDVSVSPKRICLNLSPYSIFFFLVSRLPKRFCWTRSSHVQEIFFKIFVKIFVKISQKRFTRFCSKIFAPICLQCPLRQPWTEYSHLPGKSHLSLSSPKAKSRSKWYHDATTRVSTPKDTSTQIPNLEQMHRQNICVQCSSYQRLLLLRDSSWVVVVFKVRLTHLLVITMGSHKKVSKTFQLLWRFRYSSKQNIKEICISQVLAQWKF